MADDLRVQVTALGRVIDRVLRRIDDAESLVREFCAKVEALNATAAATASGDDADQSWLLLADSERAQVVLADLLDWLGRVYLRYPGTTLPSCWLWHPALVEELWWLRQAHHDAYGEVTGSLAKIADWHDRYRPGVTKRVLTALRDCELALHEQPPAAATVPLAGSTDRVAEAWTTTRTSPHPTPEELTEADQHD